MGALPPASLAEAHISALGRCVDDLAAEIARLQKERIARESQVRMQCEGSILSARMWREPKPAEDLARQILRILDGEDES